MFLNGALCLRTSFKEERKSFNSNSLIGNSTYLLLYLSLPLSSSLDMQLKSCDRQQERPASRGHSSFFLCQFHIPPSRKPPGPWVQILLNCIKPSQHKLSSNSWEQMGRSPHMITLFCKLLLIGSWSHWATEDPSNLYLPPTSIWPVETVSFYWPTWCKLYFKINSLATTLWIIAPKSMI